MNKPIREGFQAAEQAPPEAAPAIEAAPAPEEFKEVWPIKVKLVHRAIRDNSDKEVREISFREPTGADINRYGNPARINFDGDVLVDEKKMTLMMAGLSGILSPLIEKMDPRDWNSCAYRLRGFFLPEPQLAW